MSLDDLTIPIAIPNGYGEIVRVFGDPGLHVMPDGKVAWDPIWEAHNMTLVRNLPGEIEKLYIHKLVEQPLRRALAKACANGWRPRTIGCFNVRLKRGRSLRPSGHSWGVCFDLDADWNPLILDCPKADPRRAAWWGRADRIPDEVIAAFKSEQFVHGADFEDPFDPQHFQLFSGY